ncbi:hypothetical protein [Ferrimicrobium sp.]|uniref:guanylate kinase n=1 Tax=Ferrimicrobium sp. TaxID=2926050 RepID=UPI002611E21A|nr:hypothetical protein [Ferrimicrobium sp.]MCL5974165.1 guanylate kinase [Actinomycetota bacterium]
MCGPGGVGKGTVAAEVVRRVPMLELSRSWTTRAIRPGESPDAYTFVTRERFVAAVEAGFFLEWEEFGGQLYGTPRPEGGVGSVLLEIDARGATTVRRLEPSSLIIGLEPPSLEVLRDRMARRGDGEHHIERRLAIASEEMVLARTVADHIVVNGDLANTVEEVVGLIEAWMVARSRG